MCAVYMRQCGSSIQTRFARFWATNDNGHLKTIRPKSNIESLQQTGRNRSASRNTLPPQINKHAHMYYTYKHKGKQLLSRLFVVVFVCTYAELVMLPKRFDHARLHKRLRWMANPTINQQCHTAMHAHTYIHTHRLGQYWGHLKGHRKQVKAHARIRSSIWFRTHKGRKYEKMVNLLVCVEIMHLSEKSAFANRGNELELERIPMPQTANDIVLYNNKG